MRRRECWAFAMSSLWIISTAISTRPIRPRRSAKTSRSCGGCGHTSSSHSGRRAATDNPIMPVDGVERHPIINEDWAITTWLDTSDHQDTVWQAVFCHTSQLPAYSRLDQIPEQYQKVIWRQPTYERVFSMVNGGRGVERDLFAGLR